MKNILVSCDIENCTDKVVISQKIPVLFDHDQQDGKSKITPYFEMQSLDLCQKHLLAITTTRTIPYAYGAMGYNTYTL